MNPIEKDLRSYFGITSESNILEHYGTKRHSGRYPWGSGDNPYQHSGDFLSRVEVLKKKGLSEKDILESINDSLPKEYQMSLSEFRVAKRTAIHERKTSEYEQIHKLKDEDHLGWTEIANQLWNERIERSIQICRKCRQKSAACKKHRRNSEKRSR